MENKLTDKEIKKALECCKNGDINKSHFELCAECPYYELADCTYQLKVDALDLINRLEAEVRQYAEEQHELMIEKDKLFDVAEKQKAEIERLQDTLKIYHNYNSAIRHAKGEARKEFARELMLIPRNTVRKDEIKNLLKEKVGEDNG